MNRCFLTARILKKYYNKDGIPIKILLKTPNIHRSLEFVYCYAYGFNEISKQIFKLCKIGEYLYLEGSIYIPQYEIIEGIIQKYTVLSLLVIDLQPIF